MLGVRRTRTPARRATAYSATAAVLSLLAGAVAFAAPASASVPTPSSSQHHVQRYTGPIAHPEQDYMGSTIAEHTKGDQQKHARSAATLAGVPGIDVSHYQGSIDWGAVTGDGIKFVYMKATEGTTYTDPSFDSYYVGSYNAGMIRGAYHFALPDNSSGATQAQYFVNNGGGWSADGKTLPPMLDIEYNPYGATCYGLTDAQMVSWIADFSNTVHSLTGRYPVIYTTTDWWSTCTGNNGDFGSANPLFVANYGSDALPLPNGWGFYTMWQYTSSGSVAGISGNVDRDVFNGSYDRLVALAKG